MLIVCWFFFLFIYFFLLEILRQKDREQAQILEEKMALQLKLLATAGVENVPERPDYMSLVSEQLDNTKIRKDVLTAVKVKHLKGLVIVFHNTLYFEVKK